jgi:hypothetical protein
MMSVMGEWRLCCARSVSRYVVCRFQWDVIDEVQEEEEEEEEKEKQEETTSFSNSPLPFLGIS